MLRNFELECGLAGGVFGQRAAHVGAVQNRLPPDSGAVKSGGN